MNDGSYLFDNQAYLDWVVDLTFRDTFQNMIDTLSGYHTMTGLWPDYIKVQRYYKLISANPNNGRMALTQMEMDFLPGRREFSNK